MKFLIMLALPLVFGTAQLLNAQEEKSQPRWIGECYTLFNCEGSSIGVLSDDQCRNMGGHSMRVGGNAGACMSL